MCKEEIFKILNKIHYETVEYFNDFVKKELKDRYNIIVVDKKIKVDSKQFL